MRVIFVCGPYRAKTEDELRRNIAHAEAAALRLWQEGWAVICPHKNSAWFGGACEDEHWLSGYQEIMRRCDEVYMLTGWQESVGSRAEHALARKLGIPIRYESQKPA